LTKTPFFSPIADQSTFKRITELEKKVNEKASLLAPTVFEFPLLSDYWGIELE